MKIIKIMILSLMILLPTSVIADVEYKTKTGGTIRIIERVYEGGYVRLLFVWNKEGKYIGWYNCNNKENQSYYNICIKNLTES